MDGTTFDALARNLGAATNRRQLLKGFLGGAVALAATTVIGNQASAQRPSDGSEGSSCDKALPDSCADGLICCAPGPSAANGICMPDSSCSGDLPCATYDGCPGRTTCCDGVCSGSDGVCPPPASEEDDAEVAPAADTVDTLPDTGSGSTASRHSGQFAATLAASAAAIAAARALRTPNAERGQT